MKVHELKCWPEPFAALVAGTKTFEFRKDDRDFAVGDELLLREWLGGFRVGGVPQGYSGAQLRRKVTYKATGAFGIPVGYCVLGLDSDHERVSAAMMIIANGLCAHVAALQAQLAAAPQWRTVAEQAPAPTQRCVIWYYGWRMVTRVCADERWWWYEGGDRFWCLDTDRYLALPPAPGDTPCV